METIDYRGWKNSVRLSNGAAELVVLTQVGPRIIHYGLTGGPNAFQVIPKAQGQAGGETWQPYGGHRLWIAPEVMPRSYFPDNASVGTVAMDGETLVVANPPESTTGVAKEMRLTLARAGSGVRVVHTLTNHNVWPITLAAWGLSIVANGGFVVLPQEPFVSHDDDLLPARPVVIWKFTDMADPRWRWGTKYLSLRQTDAPENKPQKVGVYNAQGWAAHVTPTQAFIVQIEPAPGGPSVLPDQGSNFETYTDGPFQELETLGPLTMLETGQSVTHTEHWFLAPADGLQDTDADLDARLLPLVAQAQAARAQLG